MQELVGLLVLLWCFNNAIETLIELLVQGVLCVSKLRDYTPHLKSRYELHNKRLWAIVTGAGDGLGAEFARQLARQGFSLILIGRSADKLRRVSDDIARAEADGDVSVRAYAIDLSSSDAKLFDQIDLQDLDIGLLVNNVGFCEPHPTFFVDSQRHALDAYVNVNIRPMLHLSHMVLPNMLKRGKGGIINISSALGHGMHSPLLTVYGASKYFVEAFSQSLWCESWYPQSHRIDVQCQRPFYVSTGMSKMRPSWLVPTPKEWVADALRAFDLLPRVPVVVPYRWHAVQVILLSMVPDFLATFLVWLKHAGVRERALAKEKSTDRAVATASAAGGAAVRSAAAPPATVGGDRDLEAELKEVERNKAQYWHDVLHGELHPSIVNKSWVVYMDGKFLASRPTQRETYSEARKFSPKPCYIHQHDDSVKTCPDDSEYEEDEDEVKV